MLKLYDVIHAIRTAHERRLCTCICAYVYVRASVLGGENREAAMESREQSRSDGRGVM